MRLREVKNIFHSELDTLYGKDEVASFFSLLLEDYLNLERFVVALQPELTISKDEEVFMFAALSRLKSYEPIQHILGKTHFMDMELKVNPHVLIPRPETEELVSWILNDIRASRIENEGNALRILDIGTGSGCIALALAKKLPEAKVYGLDVSEKALITAQENATLNALEVTFLNADIFEFVCKDKFDIIVSNPPYVRSLEKKEMHQNVLDHEPELALFVSDDKPLVFYKRITEFARENLREAGALYFEINQYLGKETAQLLNDHNFSEIEVRKDTFGNDRMLKGILN